MIRIQYQTDGDYPCLVTQGADSVEDAERLIKVLKAADEAHGHQTRRYIIIKTKEDHNA
jgi:hypothetical protein